MAAVGGIVPWVACSARSTGKSDLDVELPWWRWGDGGPSVTLFLQPSGWVQVLGREKSPRQMLLDPGE